MENQQEIKALFKKYVEKRCSQLETERLFSYLESGKDKEFLQELIGAYINAPYDKNWQERAAVKAILEQVHENIKQRIKSSEPADTIPFYRRQIFYRWVAAAVVILSCAFAWFMVLHKVPEPQIMASAYGRDMPPGGNRAVLTLADGSSIDLDSAAKWTLLRQNGITITKTRDGQIVYETQSEGLTKTGTSYNVISTPKGGQYKIILPDGSKVWLNAASSLRYPVAFTEKERRVSLTGEGYFEVAKNPGKPFIAVSGGYEVRVLGTHFNVNTYDNEPTAKITLHEGSVTVNSSNTSRQSL